MSGTVNATNHNIHTYSSLIKEGDVYEWDVTSRENDAPTTPSSHPDRIFHHNDVIQLTVVADPTEYDAEGTGELTEYLNITISGVPLDFSLAMVLLYYTVLYPVNYYGENYFDNKKHPYMIGFYKVIEDGVVQHVLADGDSYDSYEYDYDSGLLIRSQIFNDATNKEEVLTIRNLPGANEGDENIFSDLPIPFTPIILSLTSLVIIVRKIRK